MGNHHAGRGHAPQRAGVHQAGMAAVNGGDAVVNGVNDLGDQLPGLQVFPWQRVEHQQAT